MVDRTGVRAPKRKIFALLASALVLTGLFPASAEADVIEGIVPGSVKIVPWNGDPSQPVHLWDGVKVEAKWAIPNQSGKAGDQFKLGLPEQLSGFESTFELKGEQGDSLTYGTCEVSHEELVCTLNANVEGKDDVGGDLWLAVQAVETFDDDALDFTYSNNGTVTVPWVNGIDVGYRPAPADTQKEGWPSDAVDNGVFWRIAVKGSDLAGVTSTTITDTFAMPGHNFTVSPGYPQVYTLKTSDKCWSLQYSDDCRVDLNDGTKPSVTTTVDEAADVVTATITSPDGFDPDLWYAMDLLVQTDQKIKVGDTFDNKADAAGKQLRATAEKVETGAGTGRGATPTPPPPPVPPTVTVTPVAPTVTPGVCQPGADVPSDPTVEVATTEGIEYSAPVVTTQGSTVTVTVKAVAKAGYKIDEAALPAGWSVVNGEVVFTWTGQAAPCAKTVAPVAPVVTPGVCQPGADVPSDPTVEVATTEGIEYSAPVVTTQGSTVTVTVKAVAKAGYKIDEAALPAGWSVVNGEVVFTWTGQAAPCAKPTPTPTPSVPAPSPSAPAPSNPAPTMPAPSKSAPAKPMPPKPMPVKPGLPKTGS
ncbi:MAG: Ig-like domain-containing protein [Propionibacteriaceae bacterium]|nr:Ig-like domain-containing protein [Propionibacteriaceae bacterium]